MTHAELLALAKRVEKATGADRALDRSCAVAARVTAMHAPNYTASLDAAASLASDWLIADWGDMLADGLPGAALLISTDPVKHVYGTGYGTRESGCLARAMTAAALRAMAEEAR